MTCDSWIYDLKNARDATPTASNPRISRRKKKVKGEGREWTNTIKLQSRIRPTKFLFEWLALIVKMALTDSEDLKQVFELCNPRPSDRKISLKRLQTLFEEHTNTVRSVFILVYHSVIQGCFWQLITTYPNCGLKFICKTVNKLFYDSKGTQEVSSFR